MVIDTLPEHQHSAAVALWHATGLTRPWNDPATDLHRALAGHDGHRGWVYYLAVAEDHQGRGLGRQLMHASEQWLRRHNVPMIRLMVRHTNHDAVCFYKKLGYTVSDVTVLGRYLDDRP